MFWILLFTPPLQLLSSLPPCIPAEAKKQYQYVTGTETEPEWRGVGGKSHAW